MAWILACLFCANSVVLATPPDTLAPSIGNPKVYQAMRDMMEERLAVHQNPIDEFIKQNAGKAKSISAVPYLEEEFMRCVASCGANNMLTRLKATLAAAGGKIQVIFVKSEDELPVFEGKKVLGHAGTYVTVFALESEKNSKEERRKIIGRLFHEIRARSTRAKELFDEEFENKNPASEEISAFIRTTRERFEKDNLQIQQEVEWDGRITSSSLLQEFERLTFAIHPHVMNRDYMMAKKPANIPLAPKVYGEAVGIVRVIPDIAKNYKKLWEIKDNEIAAVDFYPTADPTFSRPMAIITSEEAAGLSHAEVRARYWRIPHVGIRDLSDLKDFDSKWTYIKVTEQGAELRLATEDEIKNYASYKPKTPTPKLEEVDLTTKANILEWTHATNPKEVSHKFASLHTAQKPEPYGSRLEKHFYVHWGSVIPYATYKRVLDANPGVEENVRSIVASINNSDIDDIKKKLARVRALITNMKIPEEIWGNAEKERSQYGNWSIDYMVMSETSNGEGAFVRTGTNAEDLPDYPGFGAGQYGTFSNVLRKDVKTAVKMAWASVWNEGAYIDRMKVGIDHFGVYPAVQITKAIDAKYAFVVHTADPNGEDKDKIFIEIVQGLGEGLVGDKYPGEAHRYIYSRSQDKIVEFDAATKKEKAVLNPEGGLKRAPTDYADDIFVRDGVTSALALDIARQTAAIEKAAGRPQDIEGAIEYSDHSKNHRWTLIQSRSEVGYDRAPTSWEEYFKANRKWALAFMAKHKNIFTARVPSSSFQSDVKEMLKKEISSSQDERIVGDNISNKLRLFYGLGEEGKNFAGKVLICGAGIHRELQGALGRLPLSIRAGIIAHAAIDCEMLDKDALDDFGHISNYNIARIIVVHNTNALKEIFSQIPPKSLAFLVAEVIAFHHKPKADWEAADIKDFSWNNFAKIVKDVYEQYPPDKKIEFAVYLSDNAAMNLGIYKDRPQDHLASEDRAKLLDWRYYDKPQAIILSASTIDGCRGLASFFFSLRFGFGHGEEGRNPFHFFILLDIPNERPEDFLRRNGFEGRDFTAVLTPSEINAKNIIWQINNPINRNISGSILLKGDSIVLVGPEDTIGQYRTSENEVLALAALSQRGQVPFVIAESIKLLTKTHKDKEDALTAWLTSRGLDGTNRYHEWVYEAERYLEAYEKADGVQATRDTREHDIYAPLAARLSKYIVVRGANSEDKFNESINYMLNKNVSATSDIILNAVALLWATQKGKVKDAMRGLGFITMRQIGIHLPSVSEAENEHMAAAREFFKKDSLFPRGVKELEELLARSEAADVVSFLGSLYQHFVVEGAKDSEFPRDVAEKAIAAGFSRNHHMTSQYEANLTNMCTAHPELLTWLSPLIATCGPGYEIVTENKTKRGGSTSKYAWQEKRDERDLRAVARRQRTQNGEAINPSSISEDDFDDWSVKTGMAFNAWFYNPGLAEGGSGYRQTYYPDDFYFIMSHTGEEYKELWAMQDLVEYMYLEDHAYEAPQKILGKNEQPFASVTLLMHAALRLRSTQAAILFEATSPQIIAHIIHYAAQTKTNDTIRNYAFDDEPKMRAILQHLIDAQNEKRRAAIYILLSEQAKAFLTPPIKEKTVAEKRKEEQSRRKDLARRALIRQRIEESRVKGNSAPRIEVGMIMVHEALVAGKKHITVINNNLGKNEEEAIDIEEALPEADSGSIWVDDDGKLHWGGYDEHAPKETSATLKQITTASILLSLGSQLPTASVVSAKEAFGILPQEWRNNDLKATEFIAELSALLQIENILDQDKSTFIFSEKVTFDNGLGVLLPKIAKSGMRIAVIATNDRQRALMDELNQGKPENERIVYADTLADIRTKGHAARYYYFKVSGDPDTDLQGVTTFDITDIVKKIIDALGKVCGIVERERIELLHEAARKFAEAA